MELRTCRDPFRLCLTIVGIPFGIPASRLSVLALWPFGCTVVIEEQAVARAPEGTRLTTDARHFWLTAEGVLPCCELDRATGGGEERDDGSRGRTDR